MKKGDFVTIRDSSYATVIKGQELIDGYYIVRDKEGIIIEVDCKFSNPHPYQAQGHIYNNTVVKLVETGWIVFIEERFLCPVVIKPIREVTMVDVCEQFGEEVKIKKEVLK